MHCIQAIDQLYHDIFTAIRKASEHLYIQHTEVKKGPKHITGWNLYCKEIHMLAREAFIIWNETGKPRTGLIASNMRQTRAGCQALLLSPIFSYILGVSYFSPIF